MNRVARVAGRFWPDYRTVWRWHLYAGLFGTPFMLWLSAAGTIYKFEPQITPAARTWLGPGRPA